MIDAETLYSRDETVQLRAIPAALLRFNSWIVAACIVFIGAVAIYVINNLLYLQLGRDDRAYWIVQFASFSGYLILAFTILTSCKMVDRFTRNTRFAAMGWSILITAILQAIVTGAVLTALVFPLFGKFTGVEWNFAMPMWIITNILAVAVYAAVLTDRSSKRQREQGMRMQIEMDTLATTLDRAELSMLEAQIEPHFLFNTLAHIKRQYRIDSATADNMLGSLIEYLDRALPALRRLDWTVEGEMQLILVYLNILKQRFGTRLEFVIASSDAANRVCLPALTVATLVENAVRHGIAPNPRGGEITINAEVHGNELRIDVSDNGVGLHESSGGGLGLMTARARLRNMFGAEGILLVQPGRSGGVRASIRVPLKDLN